MRADPRARARTNGSRDPWRDAPTGELGEPLLPRWFVLTAIGAVVAATAVFLIAFLWPGRDTVEPVLRRPPPSATHTTAVGEVVTGTSQPEPYDAPCETLDGVRLAGAPVDRQRLREGLAGLCNIALPDATVADLRAFASQGGIVRFATFEATGVDSTATADPPTILVNTRFQQSSPLWIAPLVVHDATMLRGDPSSARTALAARTAELAVCDRLLGDSRRSRACEDAAAIVALDDPVAALRDAGFE